MSSADCLASYILMIIPSPAPELWRNTAYRPEYASSHGVRIVQCQRGVDACRAGLGIGGVVRAEASGITLTIGRHNRHEVALQVHVTDITEPPAERQ